MFEKRKIKNVWLKNIQTENENKLNPVGHRVMTSETKGVHIIK